jgi:CheY-like chemotaxis protein/HPt (histidine-containing phosphotransfer) domain-containing protein
VPDRVAPTVAAARMSGMLVLVVDDHPVNRLLLAKQLLRLGYATETAGNGIEALDRLAMGGIGAIITDCNMPEMDGYELARRIRVSEARTGRRRVPIIACTANALGGEAANCFDAGMDDYLAKPVLIAQLSEKIARWLPLEGPSPVPPPPGGPIERSALAEISGGDPEVEREMLAQFLRFGLEDARSLRVAIAGRDVETVVRSAHRMRGSSSSVGALRLAAASGRIEASGKARDWAAILAGMEEFEHEMGALEAHLAEKET